MEPITCPVCQGVVDISDQRLIRKTVPRWTKTADGRGVRIEGDHQYFHPRCWNT